MIDVACAIIRNEEEDVLIVQRGEMTDHPLKWEFPGGKLNPEEAAEECIIREIREELSMEIVIVRKLAAVEHDYGFRQIRLIPFICDTLDDLPFLSEHIDYKWIEPDELSSVDFSEADIEVAKNYLEKFSSLEKLTHTDRNDQQVPDAEELQSVIRKMMGVKEAEFVASSAIENPEIFKRLFESSFSSDIKLAFRSSWTLSKVCDRYPDIIYPYLDTITRRLETLENEGALRSFLRIISLTDIERISEKNRGILTDLCFSYLRSGFSSIAVKAYSMEILFKLAQKYPELKNELAVSINLLQAEGSAGIVARGRLILKKLARTHPPGSPL